MTYQPVLTKPDFVSRYQLGEFGNRSPTWNSLQEFTAEGSSGLFHLRNRVAGGNTYYSLRRQEVINLWSKVRNSGSWYCSCMAPHKYNLIQGEVQQRSNEPGLALYYSDVKDKPMRDALAERSQQVYGIIASMTLKQHLCPNSYEWLQELLRRYPSHVVEFSTFSINWGILPRFNTCFWEIRNY